MEAKAVVDRMKAVTAVQTDADLAKRLGMPVATLTAWKKRNSVPLAAVEEFCINFECTLDWIIFGDRGHSLPAASERLEARSYQFGVRIALEASRLPAKEVDSILESAKYHKLLISRHVQDQMKVNKISMEEAFQAHEDAISAARSGKLDSEG